MKLNQSIRVMALTAACALSTVLVHAQHGGPPGGPGGGPGSGMPRGGDIGRMPGGDRSNPNPNNGSINQPNSRSGPQLGPPGRWWDDKKTAKTLNLSDGQQQKMDTIFNANKGQLLNLYDNLQREQAKLASLSGSDLQDEAKVFAAIDRVAAAKAEVEKTTAHILIQVRKEMDANQLATLDKAGK